MRFLRFLGLAVVVALAYLVQFPHILDPTLSLPGRAAIPVLAGIGYPWIANPAGLVVWLAVAAALGFGLLAEPWQPPAHPGSSNSSGPARPAFGQWMGMVLVLAAGALVAYPLVRLWSGAPETLAIHGAWTAGLAAFLAGAALLGTRRPNRIAIRNDANSPVDDAYRNWPAILLVLASAALLLGWRLASVPIGVTDHEVKSGFQALALAAGQEGRLFAPDPSGLPFLAYAPAALGILLTGDPLLGSRLAGLLAGLLVILGTWLLGWEFFGRRPRFGPYGELVEDGGDRPVLLAAGFTALTPIFLHYARLPLVLAPVAWGTLSLWALVRGVRGRDPLALGLSGTLLGLAVSLYPTGRFFLALAVLWWPLLLLAQRARPDRAVRAAGWPDFILWLGGLFVFLSPMLAYWLRSPATFWYPLQTLLASNPAEIQATVPLFQAGIRYLLRVFPVLGATGLPPGPGSSLLDSLTLPIFLLAMGFLLLHLERAVHWLLLVWLGLVLMAGGVIAGDQPAWPLLLPMLPAVGLALALAADRWQVSLAQNAGAWLGQSSQALVVGVLLLAGLENWIQYDTAGGVVGDAPSYVGRTIRQMEPDRVAVLLVGQAPDPVKPEDPVVQFLNTGLTGSRQMLAIEPDHWPMQLPEHSTVLIRPADAALLPEVEGRYPGGSFSQVRDRRANPLVYLYELP